MKLLKRRLNANDVVSTACFIYDPVSGLLQRLTLLFFSCRLQATFVTRTASFVKLRRYQKAGGLQDRQHEGEEDSLLSLAHTLTHKNTAHLCVCVFSTWQRVGFQTVRGLAT